MKTLRLVRAVLFGVCLFITGLHAQQVSAPQLNPAAGPKVNSPTVTLTTSTSGATIRYTLDGSTPTATTGQVYTAPLLLNGAVNTLRAIAVKSGQPDSAVTTGVYPVLNNGGRSVPLPTDRGRVQVAEIPDPFGTYLLGGLGSFANLPLKVLRSDSNQPLRGASPWVYRIIENGTANPSPSRPPTQAWVNRLVADRLNSVRICFWDAYDQAAGYGSIGWNNVDFNNPAQVEVMLSTFERWADLLSAAGIYMAVNYHNEFTKNTNEAHATAFWTIMARYFRDRTHLIFEITNEPAGTNWKSMDINNGAERKRQVRITKAIRDLDPNRFLLVLIPSGFSGGYQWASDLDPNITSRNFANEYQSTYGVAIDWTKTAVGYHNYYDPNGTSGLIRALHREFPAFWTEVGLGPAVRTAINANTSQNLSTLEYGPTLDGDRSNIQTAEKLGLGWWQWTTDSESRQNIIWPFIQADAAAYNYWWQADTGPVGRTPDQPGLTLPQLSYRYFEGSWTSLPSFSSLTPVRTGFSDGVDLATASAGATTNFGADFTGYINVPTDGVYTFYTTSDDGSWLWIGNTLVVDNDGLHAAQERSGQINLKAGFHSFYVSFFQGTGGQALSASWSGPGITKQVIPSASLVRQVPFTPQNLYSQDFAVNQGGWWSYAGDGGVTSTLGLQPIGPGGTTALQFSVTASAPPATYWYGGTGVGVSSAFPLTAAQVANSYLNFQFSTSSAVTNGLSVSLKDSANNTLTRTINAPGPTWTSVSIPLSDLTNSGFNFNTPDWQILFAFNPDAGWGLAGSRSIRIANIQLTRLVQVPPAPAITSASSATAIRNSAFTYTITASNAPSSFSATGLPAGLSLNTTTGVISGTPTVTGVSTINLGAANTGGTGNATLTLTVNTPVPVIGSATTATTIRSNAFTYTITASNSPTSFSASGLPAGLSLNTSTGVISGTPTATGVSTVTLGATNSGGTGSANLTLTVNDPAPVISSATTATAIRGNAFTYTIAASNSPTSFSANGLPAGLSLNTASGVISGTPSATGVSTITLGATNVTGTGSATLTLTVNHPSPVITSAITASGNQASAFSYTITASNSPTSYSATGLPAGLTLNTSTGVISGTPAATGLSTITLGATNVTGTGSATLTLTVDYPTQVIYADSLATNTYFWGLASWHNAGGSLSFSNGYLSFNSAVGTYTSTYGPSGKFPWEAGYAPLPDFSPLFAPGKAIKITFEARVSSPNGVNGLVIEAATSYAPDNYYRATSGPLTSAWQGYTITALSLVGSPNPANITGLAFTTGNTNLGVVDVRNIKIEALSLPLPAPVISSATTATAIRTSAFTYTITASNTPTSFSASGLPAGLSLNTTTGVISGTPTATGVSTVTLGATNVTGTGNATLTLTVNDPAPVISSPTTATAIRTSAFTYTITASNTPTSFSASGLPAGLSLNITTGVISGTPTATGVSTVTLGATNVTGTGNATLTLTVNDPAPVISSPTTATAIRTSAFTYTITASNSPTSFSATGLPAGLTLNTSTGVISGTPSATGVSTVTLGATNVTGTGSATLTLTVNNPAPVISSATTATAIRTSAFTYTITASNTPTSFSATGLPAGLTLNTSTGVISGTPTATGVSTVNLGATNVTGTGSATLTLTVNSPAPVISSATTATAIRTSAFTYTITASNTPTSFSATGLPAGLTLNTSTGVISGTPTATGVSTVTLGATNVTGTGSATLTLTVNNPAPVISSATTASGNQASAFTYTITASNSPTAFSATGLPAGLALNTSTGLISGTPSATGVSTVTLGATNVTGTGTATLTLTVAGPLPVFSNATTATARRSLPFAYTIAASNSPTSFSASGLPAGLALNTSTGLISGIPTVAGTFNVTLGATNANGTATRALTLTVQTTTVTTTYSQDFSSGIATWWKYSGDGGVVSTLTAGTFGPASSNALELAIAVTAPPATYWYAGAGVSVSGAFPSGSTTLDQCLFSLDLSSSSSVTGGVQIAIKDSTGGTLTRTLNAPGAAWTRHDLTLDTFTNTNFNFGATAWEIMVIPVNAGAWGLSGSRHLRVDNITLIRATP